MGFKKKMGMGIMAGALGVSLIGGGTWAAFNDVHEINNSITAGTLDLVIGEATTLDFQISNLKPGDYFTKQLVLANGGSLDINQVFVHATKKEGWTDKDILDLNTRIGAGAGSNTENEFLSQFNISIQDQGGNAVYSGSLADLVAGTAVTEITGTNDETVGIPAGTTEKIYDVTVTFVEDSTTFAGSRLHVQNKYQGEESNLEFVFEATQMHGEDRSND